MYGFGMYAGWAGGPSDTDRSVGSSSADGVAACAAATGGGRVWGAGDSDDGCDFATAVQIRWTIWRGTDNAMSVFPVFNGYNQDR